MIDRYLRSIQIEWESVPDYSYLHEIVALRALNRLEFDRNITFFAGENGTGKSTLLEAIAVACGFNPEGGTLNYRFSTYDEAFDLSRAIKLIRGVKRPASGFFFRAESFFNLATKAEEYDREIYRPSFGDKDLHRQSHGESFLSFFQTFDRAGLYIMDEPEAALSPQRQLALLIHIAEMAEKGAQFIIATHSPILLAAPESRILSFDGGGIHPCSYEDTESYRITKMFISDPKHFMERLLSE